jgi:hypothetical protein
LKRLLLKLLLRWKLHLLKLLRLLLMPLRLLLMPLHLLTQLHLLLTLLLPLPINCGLRNKETGLRAGFFSSVRRVKINVSAESPTHIAMLQSIRQRNGSNIRSTFLFGGHSHLAWFSLSQFHSSH